MTTSTNNAAATATAITDAPFVDAGRNLLFPKRATVTAANKALTVNRKALRAFVGAFDNAAWIGLVDGTTHFAADVETAGKINRAHGGSVRSVGPANVFRVWTLSDRVGVRVEG